MSSIATDSLAIIELVKQSGKAWTKAGIRSRLKLSQHAWSKAIKHALERGVFRAQAGGPPTTRFAWTRGIAQGASSKAQSQWSKFLVNAIAKKRASNGHIKEETAEVRAINDGIIAMNKKMIADLKEVSKPIKLQLLQPKRALPVKRETREHVSCPFCQGELIL